MWKTNKRIPKTKKYMKLYFTLKTNSHFIKFCLFGGYAGCNRNMGWFTVLSLCSLVFNKHYLPLGKWLFPNASEESYIFIILHFVSMTQPHIKCCVYTCCDIHRGNSTCSENASAYCKHLVNIEAIITKGNCFQINSGLFSFKCSSAFPAPYIYKVYEKSREECDLRKSWAHGEAGFELVDSYILEDWAPSS